VFRGAVDANDDAAVDAAVDAVDDDLLEADDDGLLAVFLGDFDWSFRFFFDPAVGLRLDEVLISWLVSTVRDFSLEMLPCLLNCSFFNIFSLYCGWIDFALVMNWVGLHAITFMDRMVSSNNGSKVPGTAALSVERLRMALKKK